MIPQSATQMATRAVPAKHPAVHESHYRPLDDLVVSSLGFGTRRGAADGATDRALMHALGAYLAAGGNVVDSAPHDRGGRSETAIGEALARELSTGRISRREVVMSSKVGFMPDRSAVEAGVVDETDIAGGIHCMAPAYIRYQLGKSRNRLQCEVLDVYYLHNPEAQSPYVGPGELRERLRAAFHALEVAVADGEIARYGVATWSAFRVPREAPDHIELAGLMEIAQSVAGERHHFRAVQVPYSAAMTGAAFVPTQTVQGHAMSVLEAAHALDIAVMTAMPLMEGRLAAELPPGFHDAFRRHPETAQRALDFVISTPWVTSAMTGMNTMDHLRSNMDVLHTPALTPVQWADEIDRLAD